MNRIADAYYPYAEMAAIVGLSLSVIVSAPKINDAYAAVQTIRQPNRSRQSHETLFLDLRNVAGPEMTGQAPDRGIEAWESSTLPYVATDGAEARRLLEDLYLWTGWSTSDLVTRLGLPSSTITSWRIGKPETEFDVAQRGRLASIHNVVERIYVVAGRDMRRTKDLLSNPPIGSALAASHYLAADQFNEAYLAALDAFTPRRTGKLETGRAAPLRARATVAVGED